jgi:hypothetical protein
MEKYYQKLIFISALICFQTRAFSQTWVAVPDPNFASYLASNFPSATTTIDGVFHINADDSQVKSRNSIAVICDQITDLTGLEVFTGLEMLICSGNQISFLPELPSSLKYLSCQDNRLTTLPELPQSLIHLTCYLNQIQELPVLPETLVSLDCGNNQLHVLPPIPANLEYLSCYNNHLTALPELPITLKSLWCSSNQISSIPTLPISLTTLFCNGNLLQTLPDLPLNLGNLACNDNSLYCLPEFPISLTTINISNNPFMCLPNHLAIMNDVELNTPICYNNDLQNNPNACLSLDSSDFNIASGVDKFEIYPNPSNGTFLIEFESAKSREIIVTDLVGHVVHSQNCSGTNQSMILDNLSAGIYNLTIRNENGSIVTKRILIQGQ